MPSSRVGSSPMPQAIAPPYCWSAIGERPQVRPSAVRTSGASRLLPCVRATPKKAWNAIVANSTSSRSGNAGLAGPGSIPISTDANR